MVAGGPKEGPVEAATEGPLASYPEIEKLIDSENFDTVNKNFSKAYEALDKISREAGGLKKSKEAKRAMKSIERVMDLLRELLKLKYQLIEAQKQKKGS